MRRPGRPRRGFEEMERKLAPFGLAQTLRRLDDDSRTVREINEELRRMTGVVVSDESIRNWIRELLYEAPMREAVA